MGGLARLIEYMGTGGELVSSRGDWVARFDLTLRRDGAKDELAAYYQEIDGKPTFGSVKTRKSVPTASKTTSTKRKAESPPAAVETEPKRGRPVAKKIKTEETVSKGRAPIVTHKDSETGELFELPHNSWEDRIVSISTIIKDQEGKLKGLVQWADNNRRSQHPVAVLYTRCPQKMLKFYEACMYAISPMICTQRTG